MKVEFQWNMVFYNDILISVYKSIKSIISCAIAFLQL